MIFGVYAYVLSTVKPGKISEQPSRKIDIKVSTVNACTASILPTPTGINFLTFPSMVPFFFAMLLFFWHTHTRARAHTHTHTHVHTHTHAKLTRIQVAFDSLKSQAAGNNTATPTSSPGKPTSSPENSLEKPMSIIESRPCSFGSPPPTSPRHPADANSTRSPEVQNGVGWNQQHSPLPISPSTRAFWTRAGAPPTPSSPWTPSDCRKEIPPLKLTVLHMLNVSEAALLSEYGKDINPGGPGSTSVGQASDLMAKWGEHHTFLPDRSLTDHTQAHWRTHIPVTQLD